MSEPNIGDLEKIVDDWQPGPKRKPSERIDFNRAYHIIVPNYKADRIVAMNLDLNSAIHDARTWVHNTIDEILVYEVETWEEDGWECKRQREVWSSK